MDGHTSASIPYIIGFSIFIPTLLAANIGLEFWLDRSDSWLTNLRDGLLNAGTMATWGIPLTIILTEVATRMWARDYVARKEREAVARIQRQEEEVRRQAEEEVTARIRKELKEEAAIRDAAADELTARREGQVALREELVAQRAALITWYAEQVARWQERQRQAAKEGKEFNEPAPEPPPGIQHTEQTEQ